jgi:hypothetical protein
LVRGTDENVSVAQALVEAGLSRFRPVLIADDLGRAVLRLLGRPTSGLKSAPPNAAQQSLL